MNRRPSIIFWALWDNRAVIAAGLFCMAIIAAAVWFVLKALEIV